MLLEFKTYKLNEESRLFKILNKYKNGNKFIVVGEEKIEDKEYLKIQQLVKIGTKENGEVETGLKMVGDFLIDEMAYSVIKSDLTATSKDTGIDYTEIEIPKKYLTLEIIETIQKLNS